MLLTEDSAQGDYRIKSYRPGIITINQNDYHNSLIVSEDQLICDWPVESIDGLCPKNLEPIINLAPEVVLLGCGEHFIMPTTKHLEFFHQHHIGIECMHTRAACSTFMALMAEKRKVVAALIINPE